MQILSPKMPFSTRTTEKKDGRVPTGKLPAGDRQFKAVKEAPATAPSRPKKPNVPPGIGFFNALLLAQNPQKISGHVGRATHAISQGKTGPNMIIPDGIRARSWDITSFKSSTKIISRPVPVTSEVKGASHLIMEAGIRPMLGKVALAQPHLQSASVEPHTGQRSQGDSVGLEAAPGSKVKASALGFSAAAQGRATYSERQVVAEAQAVVKSLKSRSNVTKKQVQEANLNPARVGRSGSTGADYGVGKLRGKRGPSETPMSDLVLNTGAKQAVQSQSEKQKSPVVASGGTETDSVVPATPNTNGVVVTGVEAANVEASGVGTAGLAIPAHPSSGMLGSSTGTATLDNTLAHDIRQQVLHNLGGRVDTITGQEKMVIRLNPESLGQVELVFHARQDQLSVVIAAEAPDAQQALQENLRALSERIADGSARFNHVEVKVELRDANNPRQQARQEQKNQDRGDGRRQDGRPHGESSSSEDSGQYTRHQNEAWESAMSWQLANEANREEG